MSGNEVIALLAYMSSAWPSVEVTEDTARVWAKQLDRMHGEDALAAADSLIRSSKFFPSISELLEAAKPHAAARARKEQEADYERKALNAGPVVGDVGKVQTLIRQTLAAQKGYEHKHGALGPCQVPNCPSVTQPKAVEHETF